MRGTAIWIDAFKMLRRAFKADFGGESRVRRLQGVGRHPEILKSVGQTEATNSALEMKLSFFNGLIPTTKSLPLNGNKCRFT